MIERIVAIALAVALGTAALLWAAGKPKPKPPRLVIVGSSTCLPCKAVRDEAAKAKVDHLYLDWSAIRAMAAIRMVPTLLLVDADGRIVDSHTGQPKEGVKKWATKPRPKDT